MNSSSSVTKAFVAGSGESALVLGTGQGSHLELSIVICNNYLGSAKHLYQDMSYFYNTVCMLRYDLLHIIINNLFNDNYLIHNY